MSATPPLTSISVGILVQRSKSMSQWSDVVWGSISLLTGTPDAPMWATVSDDGERATFYVGVTNVELHRTGTSNYRDNLASGAPSLWVALAPTDADPPYKLLIVTADPAEGEALTETGTNLVEAVSMPQPVQETIARFIAEHHVETPFLKRKRDRANPEALARRGPSERRHQKNE